MGTDEQLIILLKAPVLGLVKTRLASETGEETALNIYLQLLAQLKTNLSSVPKVTLHFTPASAGDRLDPFMNEGWSRLPQVEGDLGQRMLHAFKRAVPSESGKTVLIGADCPEISSADIRQAFSELDHHDLVLGPARDGGYWLIGLKQPHPELFSGVRWSTSRVLLETLERAWQLNLRVAFLRYLSDIDNKADWELYLAQRNQPPVTQQ